MSDTRNLKAFWKDESGVLLAETLLLLPLLLWGFVALFIYWDVFRTMNCRKVFLPTPGAKFSIPVLKRGT